MPQSLNNTYEGLPLFTMTLGGDSEAQQGVEFVALVDQPAIKRGWLAFREQSPARLAFKVNEDRHIISGPLMLANTPIYRQPPEVDAPCYVQFPADMIEAVVRKFFSEGNQANVNLMHDDGQQVQGLVMFESFITDNSRGIKPMAGYEDAPEGSWFGSFSVNNDGVWQQIKEGKFTGFSVEGLFAMLIPNDAQLGNWWDNPALDMSTTERETIADLYEVLKKVEA